MNAIPPLSSCHCQPLLYDVAIKISVPEYDSAPQTRQRKQQFVYFSFIGRLIFFLD